MARGAGCVALRGGAASEVSDDDYDRRKRGGSDDSKPNYMEINYMPGKTDEDEIL